MNLEQILSDFEQSQTDDVSNLENTLQTLITISSDIPHPTQGHTLVRWQVLASVAATDLTLAKWFESHLDAISILTELGHKDIAMTQGLWAVWAAEGSPVPIQYNSLYCSGIKNGCSGAGVMLSLALSH